VGQLECNLREHEYETDSDGVHDVEEDNLDEEERATGVVALNSLTLLSIGREKGVMGENVGNEAENGVNGGPLVKHNQEFSAHAGGSEENDCANPFDDMEESHEEEGLIINPCRLLLQFHPCVFVAFL